MSLYDLPLENPNYMRPCGCNQGSDDTDTCVMLAEIPGAQVEAFAVSTTVDPDRTPIRVTGQELDDFATAWVRRRGLAVS
ncbi:DUF397 domain-containing protein [Streptomyces sp. NPDC050095]|uniref:DUF397 domain-containing protein n=1 Tax=unclassified Streptomyces TaxID=2593676 RepID=UPI003445B2D2